VVDQKSRPIHKHPAFWGLFIIVVLFFVDIVQIKSWFGELAEDKKEHKVNQAKIAKIKQENKEAINKLALKHDAIIDNVTTNNILIHLNKRSKKATVL